jgi:hypothetical protein
MVQFKLTQFLFFLLFAVVINAYQNVSVLINDYSGNDAGLKPSEFTFKGKLHLFQIPNKPRGTVVVFPGCARVVQGFWPFNQCKQCLGFPEDVCNTKQILNQHMAIIVMSPLNKAHLCWSGKTDFPDVIAALEEFTSKHGLAHLPLYTFGMSSGGTISMGLQSNLERSGSKLRVRGVMQTVSTHATPFNSHTGKVAAKYTPPVVWVVMSEPTEKQAADALKASLVKEGVPAAVVVDGKKKVTPNFFSNNMAFISVAESQEMVNVLIQLKVINANGDFLKDPKSTDWLAGFSQRLPQLAHKQGFSLVFRRSGIVQALLNAYSHHEATSRCTTAMLLWFEQGAKENFAELAEKYSVTIPASLRLE